MPIHIRARVRGTTAAGSRARLPCPRATGDLPLVRTAWYHAHAGARPIDKAAGEKRPGPGPLPAGTAVPAGTGEAGNTREDGASRPPLQPGTRHRRAAP